MVFPPIEWYIGQYSGLCKVFFKRIMVPKVYALSGSYLDCLGYFRWYFFILCLNYALGAFTTTSLVTSD